MWAAVAEESGHLAPQEPSTRQPRRLDSRVVEIGPEENQTDEYRRTQWGWAAPYTRVNPPNTPFYVIVPGSITYIVTGWIGVILTLYVAIAVPLFVSFHRVATQHTGSLRIFFAAVDVLLLMDMAMRFVRAYADSQGKIVTSVARILRRYASGYLVIDAVASVPLSLVFVGEPLALANQLVRALRMPQTMRPVGVLKFISGFFSRRQHHHSLVLGAAGIAKVTLYMFLALHWVACGWHFLATMEDPDTSWVDKDGLAGARVAKLYVTSFYWAVTTLSTVGYGDINGSTVAERAFCIVVMLCGATLYALCIGSVSHIITSVVRSREALAHKRRHIEGFIARYKLPRELAGQVRWAGELRGETAAASERYEQETADMLPSAVRTSVWLYIHDRHIRRVPFLQELRGRHPTFVAAFAAVLHPHAGAKVGDIIMLQGAEPIDMFFLVSGRVAITRKRLALWELGPGDLFGEAGVLLRAPRMATATALEPCELYTVNANDIRALARRYPQLMGFIAESAQRSLAKLMMDINAGLGTSGRGISVGEQLTPPHGNNGFARMPSLSPPNAASATSLSPLHRKEPNAAPPHHQRSPLTPPPPPQQQQLPPPQQFSGALDAGQTADELRAALQALQAEQSQRLAGLQMLLSRFEAAMAERKEHSDPPPL